MSETGKMAQVKSGLRLAALILIAIVVAGMFFGGVMRLWFLGEVDRSSWSGRHTGIIALVFLTVSIPIMFATMNRWLKVMAAFLGLAVLNGLISLATGNVLANPTMPMSRLYALSATLFFAAASALTGTMKNRKLSAVDRISLMAFLFSLAFLLCYQAQREQAKSAPFSATFFVLMGVSLCCLLVAWGHNRIQHCRGHSSRSQSHVTAQ